MKCLECTGIDFGEEQGLIRAKRIRVTVPYVYLVLMMGIAGSPGNLHRYATAMFEGSGKVNEVSVAAHPSSLH